MRCVALLLLGCAPDVDDPVLGAPEGTSTRATGSDTGADASDPVDDGRPPDGALDAAATYSESVGGGVVLVRHLGAIIFERYANGVEPGDALDIQSGTKGFWGPAAAAMLDDGILTSFDELVSATLPEWADHPIKSQITLRHLMQLNGLQVQDVEKLQGCERTTLADDLYAHAASTPGVLAPGVQFNYGPVNYYAFAAVMEERLEDRGQNPLEYLEERLLRPLGITYGQWCHTNGKPHIPNGAFISARDWSVWGQFLLDDGVQGGLRLVSEASLDALRIPSGPNPGHGLFTWLNTPGGASYIGPRVNQTSDPEGPGGFIYLDGEPDLFAAMGGGRNRMYLVPSRDLVIVRQTELSNDDFVDHTFLSLLLGEATR